METCLRQGDVLIVRVRAFPRNAEKVTHTGEFTVARGEQTSHHHTLYANRKTDMEVHQVGKTFFVNMKVDTPLRHQEHKEIVIPKGLWAFGFETERDPFLDSIRVVQD